MSWSHGPRGSCEPGCWWYGFCHCDCGQKTRLASQNRSAGDRIGPWVKGRPMIWLNGGHAPHVIASTRGLSWSKKGVPSERVRPFLAILVRHHGDCAAVGRRLGINGWNVNSHLRGRFRSMRRSLAKRVFEEVLALDPWHTPDVDTYSTAPVQPWERIDREDTRGFEKRQYRKGLQRGVGGWVKAS